MFFNRLEELKSKFSETLHLLDHETITIDNVISSPDILYLLSKVPNLTESITFDGNHLYIVSPYKDDVIKILSNNVCNLVDLPKENLSYIQFYRIPADSRLLLQNYKLPKIQESPVATGPWGNVTCQVVIKLTDIVMGLKAKTVDIQQAGLVATKTVDENGELYYNNVLESAMATKDTWLCNFMFAENRRELTDAES